MRMERVGDHHWRTLCENPVCGNELGVDHVTLITTAHVRRFCSVDCIGPAMELARRAVLARPDPPGMVKS